MRISRRLWGAGAFLALIGWAAAQTLPDWERRLMLRISDDDGLTPARFSLTVDGRRYEPPWLGEHGLRFVSVHIRRHQTWQAAYARGTGEVEIPLPVGAKKVTVQVAKGFEYLPASVDADLSDDPAPVEVKLRRWSFLSNQGWTAADAHLHYDRVAPALDHDWFTMLAGDGLDLGQFMVLRGVNVPGIWSEQYAYGKAGVGSSGRRLLIPGEEYRDNEQGHTLLFGLSDVIQPIMAGVSDAPANYPPLHDVLQRARELGGMVGVAHGGRFGNSTAALDAVLGAMDFFEIANAFLWETELWYRLLNCGFLLPPAAGTDLPNIPDREPWQPFLGAVRMYVDTGGRSGNDAWNLAVKAGRVFLTNGPLIRLSVNGKGLGETVALPAGGEVEVEAELRGPRALETFEVIQNAKPVALKRESRVENGIRIETLRGAVRFEKSGWIAARAFGSHIAPIDQPELAHTAALEVRVGGRPIQSAEDARGLVDLLRLRRQFYAANGRYDREDHRRHVLELFDRGVAVLNQQIP